MRIALSEMKLGDVWTMKVAASLEEKSYNESCCITLGKVLGIYLSTFKMMLFSNSLFVILAFSWPFSSCFITYFPNKVTHNYDLLSLHDPLIFA